MTAITIIRQADAVHVLSDGGGVAVGKAAGIFTAKTFALPHIDAAVSVSGYVIQGPILYTACNAAKSFDDLRANFIEIVRSVGRFAEISFNQPQPFKIFVAGWSETTGPASFLMRSHPFDDIKAWEPYDLTNWSIDPVVPPDVLRACMPDVEYEDQVDPRRHGWAILNAQRNQPAVELEHGMVVPGRLAVAGFGLLTTIRPGRITQEIIGRWPEDRA